MRELEGAQSGSVFATPLLTHIWADGPQLNAQLRDSILEHARRHPGTELTNVGGWHSEPGTLEFCGTAGQRLIRHMDAMIKEAALRLYAEYARAPTGKLGSQRLGKRQPARRFQPIAHASR